MLWSAGTATVAAMNSSTTTSMVRAKRFCSSQRRQRQGQHRQQQVVGDHARQARDVVLVGLAVEPREVGPGRVHRAIPPPRTRFEVHPSVDSAPRCAVGEEVPWTIWTIAWPPN